MAVNGRSAIVHVPAAVGHFLGYAECFVVAAAAAYEEVLVLVPQGTPPKSLAALTRPGVLLVPYAPGLPLWARAPLDYVKLAEWIGVRRACQRYVRASGRRVDLVLTFIDYFPMAFTYVGLPSGVGRVLALSMRADVGQHGSVSGLRNWIKHRMWMRLSRHFPGVLMSNDPCFVEESAPGRSALLLADYSFCHGLVPMSRPTSSLHCLAIGYMDGRKNIAPLLQGVISCRQSGVPVTLTLAGELIVSELGDDGRQALQLLRQMGAVNEIPGRISDETYRSALEEAHVVWAVYKDHPFSSGVVIDAIAARRAILAQRQGVIGYYARQYPLAQTLPADATGGQIAEALVSMRRRLIEAPIDELANYRTVCAASREQYIERIKSAMEMSS